MHASWAYGESNLRKLKQPNQASCLPTAFASVLDVDVDAIFAYLGHDGTERVWPEAQPPLCYRSFHIQEMYEYALTRNYAVTTLAPVRVTLPLGSDVTHTSICEQFRDYLRYYMCVLTGLSNQGFIHAVSWDGKNMMNPSLGKFVDSDFTINHIHIVTRIK